MAETFEFAEQVTVSNVFMGELYTEKLGPGAVRPKSERQAHACQQAMDAFPALVTMKKSGKASQ
jgi:hypothetical protein